MSMIEDMRQRIEAMQAEVEKYEVLKEKLGAKYDELYEAQEEVKAQEEELEKKKASLETAKRDFTQKVDEVKIDLEPDEVESLEALFQLRKNTSRQGKARGRSSSSRAREQSRQAVMQTLEENPEGVTMNQLIELSGLTGGQVRGQLYQLQNDGIIANGNGLWYLV